MAKVELNVEDMYPTYRQAAFADFVKAVWTNSNELWQGIQQEIRDVGKQVSENVLCVIDEAFVQMPIEVDARVLIQQQPRPPLLQPEDVLPMEIDEIVLGEDVFSNEEKEHDFDDDIMPFDNVNPDISSTDDTDSDSSGDEDDDDDL